MRSFLLAMMAIALFVLQVSFIPALRPLGVVPNIALVLVALVGLYGTASLALILAVTGGLVLDLVSGADFGLNVALFIVVALTAGFIHRAGLNWGGSLMAIGLVAAATVVGDLIILGSLVRITGHWPVGFLAGQMALEIILNTLLVLLLRPVVQWLLPRAGNELEVG